MEFEGEWHPCHDGIIRPMMPLRARGADGLLYEEAFLIDTGADRTVLSAAFRARLGIPDAGIPPFQLMGPGGPSPIAFVSVEIEMRAVDGTPFVLVGTFAAFVLLAASVYSILGRDVLNSFDLIVSRPRDEIRLLSGVHSYQIVTP